MVFHKRLAPPAPPPIRKAFSSNPKYDLSLTGTILPAASPTGDRLVTNTRAGGNNLGAGVGMIDTATGTFRVIYEDKTRNVLAPQWSPPETGSSSASASSPRSSTGFAGCF